MDATQVKSWVEAAERDRARCLERIAAIEQTLPGLKQLLAKIESEADGQPSTPTHVQDTAEDAGKKSESTEKQQSQNAPTNGNGHKAFGRTTLTIAAAAERVMRQRDKRWPTSEILAGIRQLGLDTSEDTLARQLRGDGRFQRVEVKTYVLAASTREPGSNNGAHSEVSNQQQAELTKFNLTKAVREAVEETTGNFTRAQISERICEKYPTMRAKVQASQVSVALFKLEKEEVIFVEQRGEGAVPNIYRRIDTHKQKGQ